MLKRVLFTVVVLVLSLVSLAIILYLWQVEPEQKYSGNAGSYTVELDTNTILLDSLNLLYGKNKKLAPGYELQCLWALSAYPELKDVYIEFTLEPDGAPMESSFYFGSLLLGKSNRKYRILLNDNDSSFMLPILLKNLPFDAQVGILAHELGHTKYYHELSTFGVLSWALNYGFRLGYHATHERSTDALVAYRGMGWQILNYAEYVRYDTTTKEFYAMGKVFMDTYYLTPKEIEAEMDKSGLYFTK